MFNKQTIVLILIALIVVMGMIFISINLINSPKPSPNPIPTQTPIQSIQPQSTPNTKPPVLYDLEKEDKLLNIVKNRPALSEADLIARNKLISSLGNKSGILNQTASYKIEYVKAPNIFQVEILTADINVAKTQVSKWFESQGASAEGLCNLPLMFYLSREAADKLSGQDIKFNPLPEGC